MCRTERTAAQQGNKFLIHTVNYVASETAPRRKTGGSGTRVTEYSHMELHSIKKAHYKKCAFPPLFFTIYLRITHMKNEHFITSLHMNGLFERT